MIALLLALASAVEPLDEPVAVEEIVVLAPEQVADSSASVTVIAVDERLPATADLADAVGGAPGTSIRRLGGLGDFASVSIRGSAARQVEVYLDGVPLNPEGSDVVNLAELPLRAFERIEVYRGNAPPELGGSPIGGVIQLITGERTGSEASVGGGSWGTVQGHLSTSQPVGEGDLLVLADGLRTAGAFPYLDDRGTSSVAGDDRVRRRRNNDRQQGTLHLRGRVGDWTVLSAGLARESGVPGFTWFPTREVRLRTLRELLVVGWQKRGPSWSSGVSAWGSARDERLDDPAGELGALSGASRNFSAGAGARGHVRWTPDPALALVGALEGRGMGIRSGPSWTGGRRAAELTLGAVIRDGEERLALSPVVQTSAIEDRDVAEGERLDTVFLAPRMGLLVGLNKHLAMTANGGRYLRPPDLQERFGNQGVLVGNPDLRPETGSQVDAGLRLAKGAVRGEATVFAGWAVDRISWVQNSQGSARPENLDRVQTLGSELASTGEAGPVDWNASLTWTRAVQGSDLPAYDGQQVPGIPEWEWHHRLGVGSERVRLSSLLDLTTGAPLDAAGFFITAPRWLVGASARGTAGPWSLELNALNLLNRTIERTPRDPLVPDGTKADRAVTDFFGYPLPGRTFLITLGLAG